MEESKPETKIIGGVENKELAKLKLFGAGPKMQGLGISPTLEITDNGRAMRKRESVGKTDSPRKHADITLRCDKCGAQCAMTDVVPKLFEVPKDKWHCWSCLKTFIPSLLKSEKFGFEQSEREYSLREFAERADEFKREYFGLPPHNIDIDRVEEEFWRLTDDIEGELTVEYGADIQALEKGSGFCSRFNPPGSLEDKHYKDHPWNLVNLPVAKKSVLQYIDGDISGVKVPWLYVGMCFSAFAWHTEDHWTYSINYHHFGEPKIWYAASRFAAEDLERVYRAEAKDLYNHNRDLMHHITTTLSPAVLLENNVEVYRAVQNPGEFIITFPRGYHAGFNSGLNMNEAVNFCPPDWITIGRQALKNYRVVQRYNIFSQDELILKISQEAANNNSVEGSIVTLAHQDMKFMIEREVSERNQIMKLIKPKTAKTRLKNDTYCGICQTSVFCSYVVFDRRANLKLESDEIYEVAEGFVDQVTY
jgi:histone demethylase JARID1